MTTPELEDAIAKLRRSACGGHCSLTVHQPGCPVGVVVAELERLRLQLEEAERAASKEHGRP